MSSEPRELKPRLRFPEFRDEMGWEEKKIEDFFNLLAKPERSDAFDSSKIITVKLHALGVVKNDRAGALSGGSNYFKRNAGDFIFSKIDLLNGAFGIVPDELNGFYSSSDIPSFPFRKDVAQHFFIQWLKLFYSELEIERTGTSNTLKRVSAPKFFEIRLPTPPLPEQQKIADCLSSLDSLIATQTQTLEALRSHKQGLMQQLFPA